MEESETNFSQTIAEQSKSPREKVFLRIELSDGAYVGEIGYTLSGDAADLGYFIRPELWNHGYTTEAAREVLRHAFEEVGVARVEAGCISENAGSERVMQKCGMTLQRLCPAHTLHEGMMKDRVYYAITVEQWRLNHAG